MVSIIYMKSDLKQVITRKGEIPPHCFMPSIRTGSEIGKLIKPYLPVTTSGVIFDWEFDREQIGEMRVPFAYNTPNLFDSGFSIKKKSGCGVWISKNRDEFGEFSTVGPYQILERAESEADFCLSLDFPITLDLDEKKKKKISELSILNAVWMIENSRRFYRGDFPLIAVCPGWNTPTFIESARILTKKSFSALALRCQPDLSKRFGCFYWCEVISEIKKYTDKPIFLLDAKADLAQFALDQDLIYGASGEEGIFTLTKNGESQSCCSIPHAVLQLAALNKRTLPLSSYRLLEQAGAADL